MRRPRNRTTRRLTAVALAAAALFAPACGPDRSPGSAVPTVAPAEESTVLVTDSEKRGEGIYRRENCGRCHTLFDRPRADGRIDLPPGPVADTLVSRVGPDLGLEGHFRSDDWHFAHLYAPGAVVPGSRMPPSRHLFRQEGGRPTATQDAVDLVAYLQALGRARQDIWAEWRRREPAIPTPPSDGSLARRGDELYQRHCSPCHGAEGDGRGEVAGFFSFPPRDFVAGRYRFRSTPPGEPPADADLYRSITLGTGTGAAMPAFYWLDESDRWALVLRVKEFSPVLRGSGLRAVPKANGRQIEGTGEPRAPDPGAEATVREGRRLWDSLGCASCHGPSGLGMTRQEAGTEWTDGAGVTVPRSGDLTHACSLRAGASQQAIERAVVFGVGEAMPSYADALPGASSRRALVSFIQSLEQAPRTERAGR